MDYSGLMSRGVPSSPKGALPFLEFPLALRVVVVEACREAWRRLTEAARTEKVSMESFSEDEITARMKTILNDIRCMRPSPVNGFSSAIFETVVRDAAVVTYNGSSLGKLPDLVFRPINMEPGLWVNEYRGIFAECKIVDTKKHAVGLYCKKGLMRFVQGEYAWAMPSGLMIAYVREDRTVETTLRGALDRDRERYSTRSLPTATGPMGRNPKAYLSTHTRSWHYLNGDSPGDIELIHLWLA